MSELSFSGTTTYALSPAMMIRKGRPALARTFEMRAVALNSSNCRHQRSAALAPIQMNGEKSSTTTEDDVKYELSPEALSAFVCAIAPSTVSITALVGSAALAGARLAAANARANMRLRTFMNVPPVQTLRSSKNFAWWPALSVAVIVAIVHLMVAGKYDAFRNELYFIVCGRHPAFGYVDQPPLIPLLAAATQLFGMHVWLLRLPAVLAAVAFVPLTVAFAQLLGASTRGAWLAAVAAASATLVTAMTATLSTSTFEPFDFTAVGYLVTFAIVRERPRALWWAGAFVGFAFETKYGILIWCAGLAIGIALAGPRSLFRSRDLWIGVAIAAVIALPNGIWQAVHGFPFLELVHNDNSGNFTGTPLVFTIDQVFSVNFLLAPLWVIGIIAPFVSARLARFRFLSITFLVTVILILLTHGKSYYLAGAYPTIFALGAAACTNLPRLLIALWAVLSAANGVLALPLVLPVMSPARLKVMMDHMSFRPRPVERAGLGAPLMQIFSDEFGWRELARDVGSVYAALPAADRSKAAIFASNYGEAAAIDVYGVNLPPALSGNNQYYLWGPRGYDGAVVIAVNVDPAQWSSICNSARVVARFGTSPYAMPYEVNRPIVLCRGMHPPLPKLWLSLKHYGIENLGLANNPAQ
jgi:Dolichyl-phosphate-mannose-protein mannosyltransferase